MNKFRSIIKLMQGVFVQKRNEDDLTKDIFNSIEDLNYYGPQYDRINLHNDMKNIGHDMKKAVKEANVRFNPTIQ